MRELRLEVDFTYDEEFMHTGDSDPMAKTWFKDLLLWEELIVHSNEVGDQIGTMKVRKIKEGENTIYLM